mmetsp:Transcript_3969/g.6903  ORF Transcript_3969/g.6903 Transcript_3969/m.6903 type:complete len:97 (+) Transcript_3969:90-380(+)
MRLAVGRLMSHYLILSLSQLPKGQEHRYSSFQTPFARLGILVKSQFLLLGTDTPGSRVWEPRLLVVGGYPHTTFSPLPDQSTMVTEVVVSLSGDGK